MRSKFINITAQYIFILFWVMFASELFLRVFEPQPMLPRYIQAGDFGIRVNMPNLTYLHNTPDYQVEISTNNKGIRANQDFSYQKPDNVKRIIVLSDSFGMGYGVNYNDSFTEVMRRNLEAITAKRFEVINLSVSGHGTAEQLLMLRNEGIKYNPDIVLVTWHDTDPDDNLRSGLFGVEKNKLVLKNTEYLPGVKTREFLFSFKVYRWMAGNSHFYNWIRQKAADTIKKWLVILKKSPKRDTHKINQLPAFSVKSEQSKENLLSLLLMKKLQAVTEKAGAKLLILEIPQRISRTKFLNSAPDKLRNEFDVLSPLIQFEQHKGELLYWERSHGHFTPLGCEIVGTLLAERIVNNNYTFLH